MIMSNEGKLSQKNLKHVKSGAGRFCPAPPNFWEKIVSFCFVRVYTIPCAIMASATFKNPAIFAPVT